MTWKKFIFFGLVFLALCAGLGLALRSASGASVTLRWTAPYDLHSLGDTTKFAVSAYDIRWDTTMIFDSTWTRAHVLDLSAKVPAGPLRPDSFTVTGLSFSRRYFFALKSRDAALDSLGNPAYNWSPLSNVATRYTQDLIAPSAVGDLK